MQAKCFTTIDITGDGLQVTKIKPALEEHNLYPPSLYTYLARQRFHVAIWTPNRIP